MQASVARSLEESFSRRAAPTNRSPWSWALGFESMHPIPTRDAGELVERMPASAVAKTTEWEPAAPPSQQFGTTFFSEKRQSGG